MAVADWDDGGTGVPGGVAGPVERVLVVGAGVARLTAANALTHDGVDCGRLSFAGEHTQSARLAYADGAPTSGIREAKRLPGAPGARLAVDQARVRAAGGSGGQRAGAGVNR